MPDFTLEPTEIEPERHERRHPPRLVSTGIAPTAEVPKGRAGKEAQACYNPCVFCGLEVLTGATTQGQVLHLDVSQACYAVSWPSQAEMPTLFESRAYPVHTCCPSNEVSDG